jgi:hypothetical protein
MRNDEDVGDPLDKATQHRAIAVYNRWFRVFDFGSKVRMHLCLSFRIPMAHVFSMARLRLGSHGLRVDRGIGQGSTTSVMRIGCTRDAFHLVWWMTSIMHCLFVLKRLAFVKISLRLCSSSSSIR